MMHASKTKAKQQELQINLKVNSKKKRPPPVVFCGAMESPRVVGSHSKRFGRDGLTALVQAEKLVAIVIVAVVEFRSSVQ